MDLVFKVIIEDIENIVINSKLFIYIDKSRIDGKPIYRIKDFRRTFKIEKIYGCEKTKKHIDDFLTKYGHGLKKIEILSM